MMTYLDKFKKKLRPPQHIADIDNQLKEALRFLKEQSPNLPDKKMRLDRQPFYLLIGASNSGKTTLLANSKIKFIAQKKIPAINNHLPHYDIWATQHAVILDLPGNYLPAKQQINSMSKAWQPFFSLLKKRRGRQSLSGIIITLSLSDVMKTQDREAFVSTLKQRMFELRGQFGAELPFYFTITKCDLLPGFTEFFSDYGTDELGQAWGVPLFSKEADESITSAFLARFNSLINRLNQQMLTRLYQEKKASAKYLIKDFPLQLEKFKNEFYTLFSLLTHHNDAEIKGVYLTSATQEECVESPATVTQDISNNQIENSLTILQNPTAPVQTYFVKQFLMHGLTAAKRDASFIPSKHLNTAYVLGTLFIISGLIFAIYSQLNAVPVVNISTADNENSAKLFQIKD